MAKPANAGGAPAPRLSGLIDNLGGSPFNASLLERQIIESTNSSQILEGLLQSVSYAELMKLTAGKDPSSKDYFKLGKSDVEKLLDAIEKGVGDTFGKIYYGKKAKDLGPAALRDLLELNLGYDRMSQLKQWTDRDVNIDALKQFTGARIQELDNRWFRKQIMAIEANKADMIRYLEPKFRGLPSPKIIDPAAVTGQDLYGALMSNDSKYLMEQPYVRDPGRIVTH